MGDQCACVKGPRDAQELLDEFRQTGHEAPFAEIARRYAGMVYNVAVQVTRDAHDAEDATQATFLTLAVHAKTDNKIRYLGPWLRKVSHRLALDIRRSKKRRKAREEKHANGDDRLMNGVEPTMAKDLHTEELRAILREELEKLPAKYRMPLVLYYFGGLTPEEMGKELSVNTSTLGVRLHRGRKMLADSLSGRGISLNAGVLSILLAGLVDQFAQDHLVRISTLAMHACNGSSYALMPSAQFASMPAQVAGLVASARGALTLARIKMIVSVAVLVASTIAGGAELLRVTHLSDLKFLRALNFSEWFHPLTRMFGRPPQLLSQADAAVAFPSEDEVPAHRSVTVESLTSSVSAGLMDNASTVESPRAASGGPMLPLGIKRAAISTNINVRSAVAGPVYQPSPSAAASVAAAIPTPSARVATSSVTPSDSVIDSSLAHGTASLSAGVYNAAHLVVGSSGDGEFTQSGGEMRAIEGVTIGAQAAATGRYTLSGGTLSSDSIVIADAGRGTLSMSGGAVGGLGIAASKQVTIGQQFGSAGQIDLSGGTLSAVHVTVGDSGAGTFNQSGGTAVVTTATIGNTSSGEGTWQVSGGSIKLASSADTTSASIIVGNGGLGSLQIRPKDNNIALTQTPGSDASLTVRASSGADGIVQGYGAVGLTGSIVQNGRVVADGNGVHRLLDLSTISNVANTIDNLADGGSNGWYARNGGQLKLPALTLASSADSTWGEDSADKTLDLVNSLRLHAGNVVGTSPTSLTLLDAQDNDAPALPDGTRALSMWSVDSSDSADNLGITIRYDDAQAALWNIPENTLGIWVYENGWKTVALTSLQVDVADHILAGTTSALPTYIAAGNLPSYSASSIVPEPGSLIIIGLGAGCLLRRRQR